MTLESESEEVCLVRTGPKTTQKEDGPRTRSQKWRALKVNGTNSERSKRPVSKYGCRALPLDRIHSDVTSEMCPRNLNLFGPFGVFYGSINASESVYDSISVPSRVFLSSTQPQGYTFHTYSFKSND